MWFGTEDGLNRYDGYTFKTYKPDPDVPTSLSDRWISSILEDEDGQLWIATRQGGLNRYDPRTEAFTRYLHDDADPTSLSDNHVNLLYMDRKNRLWIGTASGVNLFDKENNNFKRQGHNPSQSWDLSNKNITAIFEDSVGRLWIGTSDGGLGRIDPIEGKALFFSYRYDEENLNSISPVSYTHLTLPTKRIV